MLVFYQVWEFLRFEPEFLNRVKYCCSFFQHYIFLVVPELSYLGEHSEVSQARSLHAWWTRILYHNRLETIENSQSSNSAKTLRTCLHGGGGPQVGEVTCGGSPHLSCKRDQIKMRDYVDRRVTPPTWGPPPPCKQALKIFNVYSKFGLVEDNVTVFQWPWNSESE